MYVSQAPALAIFHTPARSNRFVWFHLPAESGVLLGAVRSAVISLGSTAHGSFSDTLAVPVLRWLHYSVSSRRTSAVGPVIQARSPPKIPTFGTHADSEPCRDIVQNVTYQTR